MAVTMVQRKLRLRRVRTARRNMALKVQNAKPVIKKIDIEAIKAQFAANASK